MPSKRPAYGTPERREHDRGQARKRQTERREQRRYEDSLDGWARGNL